ncbi:hypothetical protein DSO57_1013113 [Entomophthora muscae]|uniref:Uncharacterized protein n=1 Tax=Entomophthora muscae TaxID=34485 RepID=A0ACC2U492_9FUNG|nr:hypothetical protein DSO57_1013113 [Entomophthora muscae]
MDKTLAYHRIFVFHSVPGTEVPGLKKACDHCHDTKVRCIIKGTGTCINCKSLGIICKFSYQPKPRGRKKRTKNIFSGVKVDLTAPYTSPFAIISFNSPSKPSASPPLPATEPQAPEPFLPVYDHSLPTFHDLAKYSLSHK